MIIVTGGVGFIGSNLVKALKRHTDERITVVDTFGLDQKWRNLRSSQIHCIVSPERLFSYLETHKDEVSILFHLGGVASTTENNADLMIDQNFKLTLDLVDWCTCNEKRLIYASSAATYGDGTQGFSDEDSPKVLSRLKPLSVHGWSKHLIDQEIADRKMRQLPLPPQCVGLKFFSVFGPNEYHKGSQKSVVLSVYESIRHGNSAKLFKSYHPKYVHGGQLRDFIWVGDTIDVMLWMYDNPSVQGLYNVGTGVARTFNDLAAASFLALNKPCRIDYIDMPDDLISNYQYYTVASMDKLTSAGYGKPFTPLEESVRFFVQNYLTADDIYA